MHFDTITERLNIKAVDPQAYKAMEGLVSYVKNSLLDPLHKEMIKIRASMINQCAYCIQLHTTEARRMGETEQRLYALSAWRESPLFSAKEKAILALTDEVTLIASGGVSDKTYDQALAHFSEQEISQLIMNIITINAWNRVAVSTHLTHKT